MNRNQKVDTFLVGLTERFYCAAVQLVSLYRLVFNTLGFIQTKGKYALTYMFYMYVHMCIL